VLVGALVAGYVLFLQRRRRGIVRFTAVDLVDTVAPRRPRWTRHVPTVAIVAALVLLIISLAGPTAMAKVPRNRATVVLIIDVSLSMQADDVEPSRLVAAQAAAKEFTHELQPTIRRRRHQHRRRPGRRSSGRSRRLCAPRGACSG
jgi:Ca-activated chloride channel homolog